MVRWCGNLLSLQRRSKLGFVASMSTQASRIANPGQGAPMACLAVTRSGDVALDVSQSAPVLEASSPSGSALRNLILNRPSALNAIDLKMIESIHARVKALDAADGIDAIMLSAVPGRAFCAGGDIRSLYEAGTDGDPSMLGEYFRAEYSMDWTLGSMKTTLISLLDGIVMGGGVGLSLHGKFRVATENTLFAMPENAIGLFPDCGTAHVLGKLPGGLGTYISIVGARVKGSDVFSAGLATHYVPSHLLPDLTQRLSSVNVSSSGAISRVLAEFVSAEPCPPFPHLDVIDSCFANPDGSIEGLTAEAIISRLESATKGVGAGAEFAGKTRDALLKCCPTSVKLSLEALKRAKHASLAEALRTDFRLGVRMARRPDFFAGVRSAIVTKDRNPVWSPSNLSDVDEEAMLAMFDPLSVDTEGAELEIGEPKEKSRL